MTEQTLSPSKIEYLASQLLGRIATAGADHKPHVVPTSFRYNAELGTVDVGGHHVATTKKYRDVQAPVAGVRRPPGVLETYRLGTPTLLAWSYER